MLSPCFILPENLSEGNENPAWLSGKPLGTENAAHLLGSWEPFRNLRSIHLCRQKKQLAAAF
jgi:hypothetical protein